MALRRSSAGMKFIANESGQAAVEFAMIASLLLILLCASVDFGRALNTVQVMTELTRQGSNLASRGDSLTQAISAVIAGESPLDVVDNGKVIITAVTNNNTTANPVYVITGQASQGSLSQISKIGTGVGSTATLPPAYAAADTLQAGQTLYVTELYYTFQPATPIGSLANITVPSTLYEAAYF